MRKGGLSRVRHPDRVRKARYARHVRPTPRNDPLLADLIEEYPEAGGPIPGVDPGADEHVAGLVACATGVLRENLPDHHVLTVLLVETEDGGLWAEHTLSTTDLTSSLMYLVATAVITGVLAAEQVAQVARECEQARLEGVRPQA